MKLAYMINGSMHTPLKHFAQQLDVKYAVASTSYGAYQAAHTNSYANPWDYLPMRAVKQDLEDFGMEWSVYEGVTFIDGVKLGTEARDAFCTLLENMSRLGIKTVCYNWMPVWEWYRTRVNLPLPGGAKSTGFVQTDVEGMPGCGVTISKDELWANLEYFLKKVVPVAEKGTFATMGEDIEKSIRRFAENKTLFFAHFRDVKGDRTNFQETFHHNGKTDMYRAMKTYYEVGFDGCMRPDHVPTMYGDNNDMPAYAINGNLVATGYMLGLMESIEKEGF